MRKGGYHIYYSECNERNELKMDTADVYIDDKGERYVKYTDFAKCARASSTLVKNWSELIQKLVCKQKEK
jgi:hypothetical protein